MGVVFSFAEDFEIDIPKIWLYFGEIIGPVVQDGTVPLSFLKASQDSFSSKAKFALLCAEVLKSVVALSVSTRVLSWLLFIQAACC